MKLLTSCKLVLIFITSVMSTRKCYICDSVSNPHCSASVTVKNMNQLECDIQLLDIPGHYWLADALNIYEARHYSPHFKPDKSCITMTTTSSEPPYIVYLRACVIKSGINDTCETLKDTLKKKNYAVELCKTCDKDYCNVAVTAMPITALVSLSTIVCLLTMLKDINIL